MAKIAGAALSALLMTSLSGVSQAFWLIITKIEHQMSHRLLTIRKNF